MHSLISPTPQARTARLVALSLLTSVVAFGGFAGQASAQTVVPSDAVSAADQVQTQSAQAFRLYRASLNVTSVKGNVDNREVSLKHNSSMAKATLTGSGTISVVARGSACRGNAKLAVYVDGVRTKTVTTKAKRGYQSFRIATVADDTHVVAVRLVNDKTIQHRCSRDGYVTDIQLRGIVAAPTQSELSGSGDTSDVVLAVGPSISVGALPASAVTAQPTSAVTASAEPEAAATAIASADASEVAAPTEP